MDNKRLDRFADVVRAETSDGVLRLTKVNARSGYGITMQMMDALSEACSWVAADDSLRAMVIDAEGEALQNGAVMVAEIAPQLSDLTRDDFKDIVARGHALGRAIAQLDVPVIGIARGGALGGGLELLMRSDFVFCTDAAQFSLPEVTLGFVAAWGGVQHLGRYVLFRKAQEFLLTGLPIDGKRAEDYGIVTRSFPDSEALDTHVTELLDHLRHCSPASVTWTKRALAAIWEEPMSAGEQVETTAEVEAMASRDYLPAIDAMLQNRYYSFVDGSVGRER